MDENTNIDLELIEGVGPKTKQLLNKLGIQDKYDLIRHYPFRYEVIKRSNMDEINDGDKVIIDGVVEAQPTSIYYAKNFKKLIFRIASKKNVYNITIYNRLYLAENLKTGTPVTIIGKYNRVKNTIVAMDIRMDLLPKNPQIEPVYFTTSGLTIKNISKYVKSVLEEKFKYKDFIPEYLIEKYNFTNKKSAYNDIHFPKDIIALKKARQRLKYEELFLYLLKIKYVKIKNETEKGAIKREFDNDKLTKFIEELPFSLTRDQFTSLDEIKEDLTSEKRMNRLLLGDVGCGKTIVSFLAMYINYLSGYQTALMAPTEILAKQHYKNACSLFEKYGVRIELITGSTSKKKKEEIYSKIENNEIDFIIGTHSLIQDDLKFNNLGLVITDEQHRFGVNQRETFRNKGVMTDILSMSATPIPRTYALTIYGDVDISIIKTKPVGRKEVITYFKKEKEITDVLHMMKKELDEKHQVYVIAPMIESGNNEEIENVEKLEEKMNKAFGKLFTIKSVHGKLSSEEKNEIMDDFSKHKIDILISTTVIEVGVDVKNASMIVIFNANYFGLSTIHQLRGRVGRGDIQSYCVLLAKNTYERLKMLEECNDGFEISEYDFKNRGEGDIFGQRQSGENGLKLSNIKKDYELLVRVKSDVDEFIEELLNNKEEYKDLLEELEKNSVLE